MKKYFWVLIIILIVVLGEFLRIYNVGNSFFFEGELGKELLYMRQFSLSHGLPLVGMPTSHPWLYYGPIYYWIMIPIFNLLKGSPFILFWTAVVVSAVGLIVNYIVVNKVVNRKIAIFSTLIQSVSPLLIWQTKLSKLHVFFLILIPIFMYLSYLIWNGKKRWVFPAGIIFGLMFSFHFSQIPLVGVVIITFWVKRYTYKWKDYMKFALGVILPNVTYVWRDWKILAWVPYRTLNIVDKNPVGTLQSLKEYFGNTLFWDNRLFIIGLVLFIVIFTHYIFTHRSKLTREFLPFYLVSTIGLILVANIIHGSPPIHYFLPIATIVPILYSIYLVRCKWGVYLLISVFALNFSGYFKFVKPNAYVPFYKQQVITDFIISDAKGNNFSINRIGPYDYFPENYSQNYKYLILWKGGKLVETSSNEYTINETLNSISK